MPYVRVIYLFLFVYKYCYVRAFTHPILGIAKNQIIKTYRLMCNVRYV